MATPEIIELDLADSSGTLAVVASEIVSVMSNGDAMHSIHTSDGRMWRVRYAGDLGRRIHAARRIESQRNKNIITAALRDGSRPPADDGSPWVMP